MRSSQRSEVSDGSCWSTGMFGVAGVGGAHAEHAVEGLDTGGNFRRSSLLRAKVVSLVIVFAVAFFGTAIPYFFRKSNSFLLLGTQFAEGIFLTSALMHFLSDSDLTFKHLLPHQAYSFTAMFTMIGYLLTMLADVLFHRTYHHRAFQQLSKGDLESTTEGPETKAAILRTMTLFDTLLLTLVLCFHSVFDGLAIGARAYVDETWREMWMVGLHKFILAVALGVVVLRLASPRQLLNTILYGFAFSISTSVGVAIGILINTTEYGIVGD